MSLASPFTFTGYLANRLPTVSAGLSLTLAVFVILTGQVGLYFWKTTLHSRDPRWIKVIVISIWMMQALESALTCHMTVLAHCNDSTMPMELVEECLWEWAAYVGICATTGCLVHGFFISRIHLLEINPGCVRLSMILCIILILEQSFGFISMLPFILPGSQGSHILSWSLPTWLGLSILADISIAGSICYVLHKGGPFVSMRLKLLVKRLTKFSIQTGLITSLITGVTVAIWIAAQLDAGHLFMSVPIGGVYATCLMANLIARESYFCHIQTDEDSACLEMARTSIVFAAPEGLEKDESNTSEVN